MTATRPNVARHALALGVVGSLAFNVAWAWPSPILVGVGVLMAFTLPIAVSLWRASGHVTGWARTERALIMGFIAFGAATYTAVHATLLLHDAGLPWVIAWLPALVGEALVVQAARAGTPHAAPTPRRSTTRAKPPGPPRRDSTVTAGETSGERAKRLARDRKAAQRARDRAGTNGHPAMTP